MTELEFQAHKKVFMDFAIAQNNLKLMYEIEKEQDHIILVDKMIRKYLFSLDWPPARDNYKGGFCDCVTLPEVAFHWITTGDEGFITITSPEEQKHAADCPYRQMHILLKGKSIKKWSL